MRLKRSVIYGLACLVTASCTTAFSATAAARRYYISTVFSWWPTHKDYSLYQKFIDNSKQKGMNSVEIDIPWSVETGRGKFDFTESDKRVDYAVGQGLSVFIRLNATTLGGQTPKWLTNDMLQATPDGKVFKRDTDGATIASLSSPEVRRHLADFAGATAAHYGTRYQSSVAGEYAVAAISPALDLYMETEYYPDAELDYSAAAQTSFSKWVRRAYKNIDDLNAKWGTNHKSWDSVRLKAAHPTAKHMFFQSELERVCSEVSRAIDKRSSIGFALHAGSIWDNPARRTTGVARILDGVDWLFVSDAPMYDHAFTADYARCSAPGIHFASQVDSASNAEGTNGRYFNQGVRAFEHGAAALTLANWDLSNMRDNGRWPFLHFVGRLTRVRAANPKPDRAIYLSTWDLVHDPKSIDAYLAAYSALSSGGKNPVDVLPDATIEKDPARLGRYKEIYLPANTTIPPKVRRALAKVEGQLKVSRPLTAGSLDEYGHPVPALNK